MFCVFASLDDVRALEQMANEEASSLALSYFSQASLFGQAVILPPPL